MLHPTHALQHARYPSTKRCALCQPTRGSPVSWFYGMDSHLCLTIEKRVFFTLFNFFLKGILFSFLFLNRCYRNLNFLQRSPEGRPGMSDVHPQTPSTGLRHPSFTEEGAGKRCSECGPSLVWNLRAAIESPFLTHYCRTASTSTLWSLRYSELRNCESRGGRPGLPSLISLRFLWT